MEARFVIEVVVEREGEGASDGGEGVVVVVDCHGCSARLGSRGSVELREWRVREVVLLTHWVAEVLGEHLVLD